MNESNMRLVQIDCESRCKADEYLGLVPIVHERKGSIDEEILKAIGPVTEVGGRSGCCISIQSPIGSPFGSDVPGGHLRLRYSFRALEHPVINDDPATGIGKPALDLMRRLVTLFEGFTAEGRCSAFTLVEPGITPVQDMLAAVAYECTFECEETAQVMTDRAQNPQINFTGAGPWTVTLACATAGAAIYYSTDGSYPRAGAGTLYAAPFAVGAAGIVRAAAYKAGLIQSDVSQTQIG